MNQLRDILDMLTPEQRARVTGLLAEYAATLVRHVLDGIDVEALAVDIDAAFRESLTERVRECATDSHNHMTEEAGAAINAAVAARIVRALEAS